MKSPHRRALQVLTVAVSAYYALWACAPAAALRPMTLDLERPDEFGLGGTYVGAAGGDPCDAGGVAICGPSATFWYQHRFTEHFSFGGTIFGGQPSLYGGGVQARFHLLETDRWRLGADAEAGFLWGAVGLPVSLRLVDDLFVYTSPSVGFRAVQPLRVPLGIAWGLSDNLWLHAEGTWGYDFLTPHREFSDGSSWGASFAASIRF